MSLEPCKGLHCVDLGESFQTHVYLQNSASIQPRTSPLKFVVGRAATNAAERLPAVAFEDLLAPANLAPSQHALPTHSDDETFMQ